MLVLAVTACILTHPALAEGEHSRRAATELLVLRGDVRKLTQNNLSDLHIIGLKDRIGGGLAGLEIMLRLADQQAGIKPVDYSTVLDNLRTSWRASDFTALADRLSDLQSTHPFRATGILPIQATTSALTAAKELHEDLCAGCHDDPDLDVPRPAYNLFEDAQQLSGREFAARMSVGVRGDRITGIDNPLTDAQISALMFYYKSTDYIE